MDALKLTLACLVGVGSSVASAQTNGACARVEQKLEPPDPAKEDYFGWSVALEGDTLVVGSRFDDDKGTDSGSVYVYVRDGAGWTQQAKLVASDGMPGDQFGWAVTLSGDTIAVGAVDDDGFSVDQGSAYVFVRNGTIWSQEAKLQVSAVQYAHIGRSVSLDGDRLAVGASGVDKVLMYERTGTSWTLQQIVAQMEPWFANHFGGSVSLSGDWLLVGARDYLWIGAAYFFEYSGGTWQERQRFIGPNGQQDDLFGYSVSLEALPAFVWAGQAEVGARAG
jgi:hypothetical protein